VAGRIPKGFIDELLMRADIVDVIDARVPLTKAGKDYKARCPFHDEKTPSFTVSSDKQFYHCFGCGAHGSAIGFLMAHDHMEFREAVEELAARVGLPLPQGAAGGDEPQEAGSELLDVLAEADHFYQRQLRQHPSAQRAVDYLKGRGVSGEIAKRYGIGFAADGWDNLLSALANDENRCTVLLRAGLLVRKASGGYYDRFRNRVMFPIHDTRGRVVGFGGRVLDDGEPKYLNSPETPVFHKGREVYGLDLARAAIRREQRVLVVEGYMDVLALAQFGIDFAVATLGTATTREHLQALFRLSPDVIFCFDGDRAGREAAWRALETALPTMQDGRQVSFLLLPEGEDPDSLVRKEGAQGLLGRLTQSRPLPDFLFEELQKQVDVRRLDGRARLAELARPLLAKLPQGVLRQMMVQRLAEFSGIGVEKLLELVVGKTSPPATRNAPAPSKAQLRKPPSPVRTAIALLLHQPGLARAVGDTSDLAALDLPGMPLLLSLLDLLKCQPGLTTGALIERFRDSEYRVAIERLLEWPHPALQRELNLEAELSGTLGQLRRALHAQRTDELLRKERLQGLGTAEKAELSRLLAERQGSGAG
jgi:DNA primase